MIKTYVIDTNVLIQAPYAVNCFEDNQIVLPVAVLEELDNLKKADGERGANARKAIRILEELRRNADLLAGVGWKAAGACGWRRILWMWRSRRICRMTRWITGY